MNAIEWLILYSATALDASGGNEAIGVVRKSPLDRYVAYRRQLSRAMKPCD